MRTVLFINAHSRHGDRQSKHVIKIFKDDPDFDVVSVIIVEELKKLREYLAELRAIKNLECVIVGSGDGTIVAVLNALRNRKNIVYGFLPLGTSNTFVRSLGLPATYKKAMAIIGLQTIKSVTLGSINGVLFPNIAGIGVPSRVADNLTNRMKRYLGPFAYVVSGLRELVRHDAFLCSIYFDGKIEQFYTHHLLIANGKYHGHLPIGKAASLRKNQLVIVAFGITSSRWHYLKSMLGFGFHRHERDQNVRSFPITKAYLTTKPGRRIEADGELISKTPATILVIERAIKVFAV